MLEYRAPLEEFEFLSHQVLRLNERLPLLPEHNHVDADLLKATLEAGSALLGNQLLPLNGSGDASGCALADGSVSTPAGFPAAYAQFQENGWPALTVPLAWGGQGFPATTGVFFDEMLASTNVAFSIFAKVREGVLRCVQRFGDERVRELFGVKLASGEWLGTMCLTEPQAGSDLGLIRTTARVDADGNYRLSGTKIFISNGDHDLTSNIVHLVLARTEGAPAGTGGLSLFAVPKYRLEDQQRNGVSVIGLEHKHGIRANATCSLTFEGSLAYPVGETNRGLACMFLLMNSARLAVGVQTVGLAETAYQNALRYANERHQGRALNGATHPSLPADPLTSHIGVRSALIEHRLFIEPARLLCAWAGLLMDESACHPDEDQRKHAAQLVELMTPIIKGYLSNQSGKVISSAMQLFGGHGYIVETGMEQLVRDHAICPIYEGTNYIQSLDLLARKVLADQGRRLKSLAREMLSLAARLKRDETLAPLAGSLQRWVSELEPLMLHLAVETVFNRDVVGRASPDYMELIGTMVFGHLWAWMAEAAQTSDPDSAHTCNKVAMAELYISRANEDIPTLIKRLMREPRELDRLGRITLT